MIHIAVQGTPQPLQSITQGRNPYTGKSSFYHKNKKAVKWKEEVIRAVREQAPAAPWDCPVASLILFKLPLPKSDKGRIWALTKPDIDNLLKPVQDAIEKGGVLINDSRICLEIAIKICGAPGLDIYIERIQNKTILLSVLSLLRVAGISMDNHTDNMDYYCNSIKETQRKAEAFEKLGD